MNAYTYFKNMSLSVEPDMPVEAAGEKEDTEEIIVSKDALTVSETENPIDTLNTIMSDTSDSEEITVSQDGNVIALIDTGVGESANVIDRVSVIEEPETSTEHGDAMLQAIVSQNPDAKILSIRAMNSNGFGTISSLVAAMEYAISENVDMINLSLYARTTLSTSVLKSEIQKAVDAGITVIGAAGNDGVDVVDYVPGSVESAYIIGAATEDGSRLETSNFGATVDYNVVAESTSEATALFTGYVSKNGLDKVSEVLNQGMIYETGFGGEEEGPEIEIPDEDLSNYEVDKSKKVVVKYLLAYADEVRNGDTIDSLYERGVSKFPNMFAGSSVDESVELYTDGKGTYKFKANGPLKNGYVVGNQYADSVFARCNAKGEVITDGVHLDLMTGVATVEEGALQKKEGDFADIQVQILVPVKDVPTVNQTIQIEDADGFVYEKKSEAACFARETITLALTGAEAELTSSDFEVYINDNRNPAVVSWDNEMKNLSLVETQAASVYKVRVKAKTDTDSVFQIASASTSSPPIFYLKDVDPDDLDKHISKPVTVTSAIGLDGWPSSPPPKTVLGHSYEDVPGYDNDASLMGWIGIPKNLFGLKFECVNLKGTSYGHWDAPPNHLGVPSESKSYNAGIGVGCIHIGQAALNTSSRMKITYKITKRFRKSNDDATYYIMNMYGVDNNNDHYLGQTLGCSLVFGVKPATGDLKLTKILANSSESGTGNYADKATEVKLTAKFQIYSDKACTKKVGSQIVFNTTDMKASKTVTGLKPGTYYLREEKRSSGCADDLNSSGKPVVYEFKITAGKTTTKYKNLSTGEERTTIRNLPIYFKGKLIAKQDSAGNPLEGAIFEIKHSPAKKGSSKYKVDYTWYLKSDANGDVLFDSKNYVKNFNGKKSSPALMLGNGSWALPKGYYYIREVQAPEGYELLTKEFSTALQPKSDEHGYIADASWKIERPVTIVNEESEGEKWKVAVNTKKVNQGLKPLAGAKFKVWTNPECTGSSIGSLTSGSDGMTNTLVISVKEKEYPEKITLYCKETQAPDGYVPTDEIFSVTFYKKDFDALNPGLAENPELEIKYETKTFGPTEGIVNEEGETTPTPTPPDSGDSGPGVHVKKTSTANQEILDLDSYSLAGAEFSVTGDGFSGTLVTDENGNSNSLALPDNHKEKWHPPVYDEEGHKVKDGWTEIIRVTTTYYVRETKAPKGHKLNPDTKSFTVTMPDDKDRVIEIGFEDEPIFSENELDIEKLGVKGNPIQGIVFKTEFFDSDGPDNSKLKKTWYLESDGEGKVLLDNAHISHRLEFQSDPFFTHKGEIVIPIDGYLQLTEVAAPAEYVIDDTPFGFPTGETLQYSKRVYNDMVPCAVHLLKYSSPDDEYGGMPLEGVQFKLTFLEETIPPTSNISPDFDRLLKVGESIIRTTDMNGEVSFENLDHGKYQITEVKTQGGYSLLKDPIIVTLPIQMTEEEAEKYGNVDFDKGKEDVSYTDNWFFYDCLYEVTNDYNFKLPSTGGFTDFWTFVPLIGGMGGLAGVGAIATKRKKKKRE